MGRHSCLQPIGISFMISEEIPIPKRKEESLFRNTYIRRGASLVLCLETESKYVFRKEKKRVLVFLILSSVHQEESP